MKNEDFSTAVDKKQITCKDYEDREFTLKNGKEYRNQSADAFNSSDGLPPFSHMNIASYLKYEVQLKKFKGDLLTAEYNFRQYRELVLKCENLFLKCQENIETLTNEINQSKLAIDASSSAMLKDLEILIVEIQEREKKVKKLMAHKEEIREALKKEWEKMIQMDEEHERDKDEALDEREEYYSNLQSDSIKLKREKAAKNSQHLKQQYEARDKKLTEELTEIKMFHKNICKEKHRLIAELEVEKNKLKESREKENNFEVETSQRKLSEEMSLQVAEKDRLNREVIQNQD